MSSTTSALSASREKGEGQKIWDFVLALSNQLWELGKAMWFLSPDSIFCEIREKNIFIYSFNKCSLSIYLVTSRILAWRIYQWTFNSPSQLSYISLWFCVMSCGQSSGHWGRMVWTHKAVYSVKSRESFSAHSKIRQPHCIFLIPLPPKEQITWLMLSKWSFFFKDILLAVEEIGGGRGVEGVSSPTPLFSLRPVKLPKGMKRIIVLLWIQGTDARSTYTSKEYPDLVRKEEVCWWRSPTLCPSLSISSPTLR